MCCSCVTCFNSRLFQLAKEMLWPMSIVRILVYKAFSSSMVLVITRLHFKIGDLVGLPLELRCNSILSSLSIIGVTLSLVFA